MAGGSPNAPTSGIRYGSVHNRTFAQMRIASFTCPSDIANAPLNSTNSYNYATNFGNTTYAQATYDGVPFLGAPFGNVEPDGYRTVANCSNFATITDGLSNTLAIGEVIQGQGTDLRGFIIWGDASNFTAWNAPNSPLPDVMSQNCNTPAPGNSLNPPCVVGTGVQAGLANPTRHGARSRHPGGVNVGMSDGSIKFIKNSTNIQVWRALSSSRGGEIVSADAY